MDVCEGPTPPAIALGGMLCVCVFVRERNRENEREKEKESILGLRALYVERKRQETGRGGEGGGVTLTLEPCCQREKPW